MASHPRHFVRVLILAVATSFCGSNAVGQDPIPFENFGGSFDAARNTYGWVRHIEGRQIGDVQAFTNAGATKYWEMDSGVLLATGAFGLTNDGMQLGNVGLQRRVLFGETILGGGLWFDAGNSIQGNVFQQGALSLELLHDVWSVRMNGYLPMGPRSRNFANAGGFAPFAAANGDIAFQGHNLVASNMTTLRLDEVAMKGIDFEMARSISDLSAEAFIGYYNFQGREGGQTNGIKGGVRGYVTPRLAANVAISSDPIFGTNVYGGFTWFFGGPGGNAPRTVEDKLTIPVVRNEQVVVNEVVTQQSSFGQIILTNNGQPISVNHVNDGGVAGDGSFENPHGSLTDANNDPNKNNRDIVYVYSGTTFVGQDYMLALDQRFLGEGDNNQHLLLTDQLGFIDLPNVFGLGNPRPVIQAPVGRFAVNAANGSEISNFDFVNSGVTGGVFLGGLAGNANLNRSRISGGVIGVDVSGSSGQIDLTEVDLTNVETSFLGVGFDGTANVDRTSLTGGDVGIDIIGGTGQFTFTDTTITDPNAAAVNVNGGTAGINFDATSQITQSTPAGTGLQFNDANGEYSFSGPVTLSGGDAGIDIIGNSNGTFTFSNTEITDPTGTAFNVDGGSADVTYSGGFIRQGNNASTINVQGGHTGTLRFGIDITGTNGNGLQFDNANGEYNFNTMNGFTLLNGADSGIDIIGSSGQFTFSNTEITDPTGPGVRVDGGSADITFDGTSSLTQSNNAAGIDILGGHTGTFTFSSGTDITVTNGTGLQFNNADGTYNFNGPATLSGADAGIDIIGSTGTFTFSNTDIGYSGTNDAVNINNHNTGAVTFGAGSTITATNGTGLQFNNADGTYNFNGPVTLNGGDAGIDIIGDSAGTFTFSGLTEITNPSGTAFQVKNLGVGATINYNGSINSTTGGDLIDIDTTPAGSQINFNTTGANSITGNGAGGIVIFDADGNITFTTPITIQNPANGAFLTGISIFGGSGNIDFSSTSVTLPNDGFNAGVEINNHSGGITFNNLGIEVNGSGTPGAGMVGLSVFQAGTLNLIGANNIDVTGGDGIVLDNVNSINMTFDSISVTNSQFGFGGGSGITLADVRGGTFDVTGTTTINGANGPAGIGIDIDDSAGSFTFSDVDIDMTTLDGIAVGSLFGNPGTVNINGGMISNTGANGVLVNNAGGFNLNNTTFNSTTGFTIDGTGSVLSGSGNVAVPFSSNDGGGNTGSIQFNGGADSFP